MNTEQSDDDLTFDPSSSLPSINLTAKYASTDCS